MILVQHVFGLDDIKLILGHLFPRQFRQPVEIGAYDAGFRRVAVHRGEPLELLVGFFAHVGGKPGLFDGLGDVFQFLVGVGAVAQFLADGLELFAQVIFLLRLVHAFAGRGLDLDLHGRHFGLMHQMRDDEAQAIHRIDALEDFLRFLHLEPQVGGDEIGRRPGSFTLLRTPMMSPVGMPRRDRIRSHCSRAKRISASCSDSGATASGSGISSTLADR